MVLARLHHATQRSARMRKARATTLVAASVRKRHKGARWNSRNLGDPRPVPLAFKLNLHCSSLFSLAEIHIQEHSKVKLERAGGGRYEAGRGSIPIRLPIGNLIQKGLFFRFSFALLATWAPNFQRGVDLRVEKISTMGRACGELGSRIRSRWRRREPDSLPHLAIPIAVVQFSSAASLLPFWLPCD